MTAVVGTIRAFCAPRISYEEYHPYGSTAWWAGSSATVSQKRYRFTGMERDEETGLQCHGVRYYAVWLGRWVSADPIGLGDGVNRFGYCHGGPTLGRDSTGLADGSEADDGQSWSEWIQDRVESSAGNSAIGAYNSYQRLNSYVGPVLQEQAARLETLGLSRVKQVTSENASKLSSIAESVVESRNQALEATRARLTPSAMAMSVAIKEKGKDFAALARSKAKTVLGAGGYSRISDEARAAVSQRVAGLAGSADEALAIASEQPEVKAILAITEPNRAMTNLAKASTYIGPVMTGLGVAVATKKVIDAPEGERVGAGIEEGATMAGGLVGGEVASTSTLLLAPELLGTALAPEVAIPLGLLAGAFGAAGGSALARGMVKNLPPLAPGEVQLANGKTAQSFGPRW